MHLGAMRNRDPSSSSNSKWGRGGGWGREGVFAARWGTGPSTGLCPFRLGCAGRAQLGHLPRRCRTRRWPCYVLPLASGLSKHHCVPMHGVQHDRSNGPTPPAHQAIASLVPTKVEGPGQHWADTPAPEPHNHWAYGGASVEEARPPRPHPTFGAILSLPSPPCPQHCSLTGGGNRHVAPAVLHPVRLVGPHA